MASDTLHLEHSLPGRVRLRVPKPRTAERIHAIGRHLAGTGRVRGVEANPHTGSLFLSFDPEDPLDVILADVRGLGYVVEAVAHQVPQLRAVEKSDSATAVQHFFAGANHRFHEMTDGKIDLRMAVPAVYALLAVRAFLREPAAIGTAPWYQLVYWAFDAFHKLHDPVAGGPADKPSA